MRYALGTECNLTEMHKCISDFHHYEEKTFPTYGIDEIDLDETCRKMNATLMCPYQFDSCSEESTCDEDCQGTVALTHRVKDLSYLTHLHQALCEGSESFRAKYLEHSVCLHQTASAYEECYNTSAASLVHLYNNRHLLNTNTKCCLFSWMLECYHTKTAETCGEDAANIVSTALKILRSVTVEECLPYTKKCASPPLPGQDEGVYQEEQEKTSNSLRILPSDQISLMFVIIIAKVLLLI